MVFRNSLLTVILFLLLGCSSVRESEILGSRLPLDNPVLNQPDSITMMHVKSRIQSDPNHIMAESIIKLNGSFVLSLSPEEAITIGIDHDVINKYYI